MNEIGFMRWRNPDSTIDLICLSCLKTVARSRVHTDLSSAEVDHVCWTADLILLQFARGLVRAQEEIAAN